MKFNAPIWRKRAECWIDFFFPASLELYERAHAKEWDDFNPVLVAEFASSFTPSALPAALYDAAMLPIEDIVEDTRYRDGETFTISKEVMRTIIVFRDRYRGWLSRIVVPLRTPVQGLDIPRHCCTDACSDGRRGLELFYHRGSHNLLLVNPMEIVEGLDFSCKRCCVYYTEFHAQLRRDIWHHLPVWAGRHAWIDFPRRHGD